MTDHRDLLLDALSTLITAVRNYNPENLASVGRYWDLVFLVDERSEAFIMDQDEKDAENK